MKQQLDNNLLSVTPQHNERGEEKRDNIPKQEKKVEVKGHAYGDEKPTTRKWSTTEAFTSEERDKLVIIIKQLNIGRFMFFYKEIYRFY